MAEFEITGPNGVRYIVDAPDEAAAQRAADFINTRIEAGDFDLVEGAPADIAVQREAPETTGAGAFLRNFADTGFFNWGDEIASFGNALGLAPIDTLGGDQQAFWNNPEGFWSAFENNMDEFQRLRGADEQQHSFASGAGDVTGALAGALAAVPRIGAAVAAAAPRAAIPLAARIEAAALGRPVASAVGRGAAEGAAFGALAGAGEGRGNRAQSAAMGGTIGAMGGAAIGGAIAGLGPAVRRYWNVLRNNNSEDEARRQLVQALQRDGFDVTSPEGVATLRQEFQNFTGRPLSLADVGAATRARVGVGLRAPSSVQQQSIDQVVQRTQGQRERLTADIRANVAPRTDVHALDETLTQQRAEAAEELRQRALYDEVPALPSEPQYRITEQPDQSTNSGVLRTLGIEVEPSYAREVVPQVPAVEGATARQSRVVTDPVLQQLARLPDAQAALQAALARSRSEVDLRAAQGLSVDALPDLSAGSDLDMRTFDMLKRFLDDEVNALYRRGDTQTFRAGQAGQVRALRDAIRDRLRRVQSDGTVGDQPGPYGDYLDAYAGSSEMIDALEAGRSFRRLDPEQIVTEQAGRSRAGQELYRVGAARDLEDLVRGSTDAQLPANRIANSDISREQIRSLGLEDFDRLIRNIQQERQLNLLPMELRGSQTEARRAAREDAEGALTTDVPFNPASGFGWMGALLRGATNRASTQRNAAVNESLLPRALETNPQAIEGVIAELEATGQELLAAQLRRRMSARNTSRAYGTTIGGAVALPREN